MRQLHKPGRVYSTQSTNIMRLNTLLKNTYMHKNNFLFIISLTKRNFTYNVGKQKTIFQWIRMSYALVILHLLI